MRDGVMLRAWALAASLALVAGAAEAQEDGTLNERLREILDRQQEVERENAALREELEAIKARVNEVERRETQLENRSDSLKSRVDVMMDEEASMRERLEKLRERIRSNERAPEPGAAALPQGAGELDPDGELEFGANPGGGGVFLRKGPIKLTFYGFIQVVGAVYDGALDREDGHGDLTVRAARLDWQADLYDRFQVFVELETAVPTNRPLNAGSDFGLVIAALNTRIVDDALQLRVGKWTNPFSTENYRSSRDFDTIERFMALNSLFFLPALDSQYMVMLHGQLGKADHHNLGYFLVFDNGNGQAFDNLSDDNDHKSLTGKLVYSFTKDFSIAAAANFSREELQMLALYDLQFTQLTPLVPIKGKRFGIGGDIYAKWKDFTFRAEWLSYRFEAVDQGVVGLHGGFAQLAYAITGDRLEGFEVMLRGETAYLDARTGQSGKRVHAGILALNWYINPNVRLQNNAILTHVNGPSLPRGFSDEKTYPMFATELQFKF